MILALLSRFWRPLVGILLIGAVVGFVFVQGHKRGLAKGRAELDAYRVEVGTRILEANAKADQAAQDFETWKRNQRPRVITVIKEVDRAIEAAPEWSRVDLPGGVRDALTAAVAAVNAPGESDGAVPAGPRPEPADERGPRSSLPGGPDLGGGMQGEAQALD